MRQTLETRLGLFFALGLVAAVLVLEFSSGLNWFQKGYELRADFADTHQLKVGDPVNMGGVPIGRVKDLRLKEQTVEVLMEIRQEFRVKTDSQASVQFAGLMGQNFVSLSFGSPGAPTAKSGMIIETLDQPDINSLMAKMGRIADGVESITQGFDGGGISDLLGPLTDFVEENRPRLTKTFANIEKVSTQIADGEGTLGRLVNEEGLYDSALTTIDDLKASTGSFQDLATDARQIMADVRDGKGTIGKLATDETLYHETTGAMTHLREILGKVNQGEGSIGKLVNDREFYENLKLTLRKLERATDSLEDTGPLSVVGTAAGSLF